MRRFDVGIFFYFFLSKKLASKDTILKRTLTVHNVLSFGFPWDFLSLFEFNWAWKFPTCCQNLSSSSWKRERERKKEQTSADLCRTLETLGLFRKCFFIFFSIYVYIYTLLIRIFSYQIREWLLSKRQRNIKHFS